MPPVHRRLTALLVAVGLVASAIVVGVAVEQSGGWGDPGAEPPLIGDVEQALGVRFEHALGMLAPGGEADAVGVSPDAPTEPSDASVIRPRMAQFDGDLRDLPQTRPRRRAAEESDRAPASGTGAGGAPLRPSRAPARFGPAPAADTSDGLDHDTLGAGWPPDDNIDVGANDVVETVNTGLAVYDKATREQRTALSIDALFAGQTGTPCDNANMGDPIVVYDTIGRRWIVSDFAWAAGADATGPFYECLAVSKGEDPVTGGWWYYAYETGQSPDGVLPATHDYFPDYPKLGVWPDGIYMTLNLFGPSGYSNPRLVAFNRTALEAGTRAAAITFDLTGNDYSLLPANARAQSGLPPDGRPAYFAEFAISPTFPYDFDRSSLTVWSMHVDWSDPSNATIDGPTSVTIAPWYQAPETVPSPGNRVDTLSDRLMMQLQYANIGDAESLWVAHTSGTTADPSDPASTAFPIWRQLDVTDGVIATDEAQSGMWAPDAATHRFMPSLAVDHAGDVAMGYAASAALSNPSIRYAGRLASDPAGEFGYGERVLQAGTGAQTIASGGSGPITRWGDYAAMTVDPTYGCQFWNVGEYYAANGGNWHTAISSFSFPSCTPHLAAVVAPTVSLPAGGAAIGAVATAANGEWSAAPTSYGYMWERNAGSGWTPIPLAMAQTYALTADDIGAAIRCVVTAADAVASGVATSAPLGLPESAVGLPATGAVGQTITATRAVWPSAVTSRTYVWRRDGLVIAGADAGSYRLAPADGGSTITVTETADGGRVSTSGALHVAPYAATKPTFVWRGGKAVATSVGGWTAGPGASTAYRWVRGPLPGSTISGATGSAYTVVPADRGRTLCLRIQRSEDGATGTAISECSAPSWAITGTAVRTPTTSSLAGGVRVSFTAGQSATFTVVVRDGRRVVGRATAALAYGVRSLVVRVDRDWRAGVRAGTRLRVAVSGTTATGVVLTPGTAATRILGASTRPAPVSRAPVR